MVKYRMEEWDQNGEILYVISSGYKCPVFGTKNKEEAQRLLDIWNGC
jgi:hypothetical protein